MRKGFLKPPATTSGSPPPPPRKGVAGWDGKILVGIAGIRVGGCGIHIKPQDFAVQICRLNWIGPLRSAAGSSVLVAIAGADVWPAIAGGDIEVVAGLAGGGRIEADPVDRVVVDVIERGILEDRPAAGK